MESTRYVLRSLVTSFLSFCVTVWAVFGGLFKPVAILILAPGYLMFFPEMFVGAALGFGAVLLLTQFGHPAGFRWPAMVSAAILGAVIITWISQSIQRGIAIDQFAPERLETNSFLWSLRNTPDELQLELHAVAMKDCVPYGWSYRRRAFYEIPHNAAINVVPSGWLEECGIDRTPT
jgi:hypothetical protein